MLDKLKEIVSGFLYPSESDTPVNAVEFKIDKPIREHLLEINDNDRIRSVDIDWFFSGWDQGEIKKFLLDNFKNVSVYKVGRVQVQYYALSRVEEGHYIGIHTVGIET